MPMQREIVILILVACSGAQDVVKSISFLDSALPPLVDSSEAFSVLQLQRFVWDLDFHGTGFMDFSVFQDLKEWGSRPLPPKGRSFTFSEAFRGFESNAGSVVVELGSCRSFVDGRYPGCNGGCFDGACPPEDVERLWRPEDPSFWDWGAGMFGRLAALCLQHVPNVELHQVDLAPAHIARAAAMNSDMPFAQFYRSSSEEFLENFEGQIDLLYLDTGDISPIEPSAQLQKREAEIIIKRDLIRPGGLILIDDVLHPMPLLLARDESFPDLFGQPVSAEGKAKYSLPLLLAAGFELVANEFQVLLQRPHLQPHALSLVSPRHRSAITRPHRASGWLDLRSDCAEWPPQATVRVTVDGHQHLRISAEGCSGPGCSLCTPNKLSSGRWQCRGWIGSDSEEAGRHLVTVEVVGAASGCLAGCPRVQSSEWTTLARPQVVQKECRARSGQDEQLKEGGREGAEARAEAWGVVARVAGATHAMELSVHPLRTPKLLAASQHLTSLFLGFSSDRLELWQAALDQVRPLAARRWTPLRAGVASGAGLAGQVEGAVAAAVGLTAVDVILLPCAEDEMLGSVCEAGVAAALAHAHRLDTVVASVGHEESKEQFAEAPSCWLDAGRLAGVWGRHAVDAVGAFAVWTHRDDICATLDDHEALARIFRSAAV